CKPSDKYAGKWFAISDSGDEVTIDFLKDKTMTITDDDRNEKVYDISQTSVGIQNSVGYYRVEIDGKSHYVVFENRKDESNAILIKQTNHASDYKGVVGDIIYTMNRDHTPD